MIRRRTVSLLVTMMKMMVLLDLNCVWTLPAPSHVSMDSVDMRHVLKWRPLEAPCDTAILYSVQFQGEFELIVLNGSWVDAHECQQTPLTHCDLTFALGSDSDYSLHVRAQCGSLLSPWSQLSPAFNRRDTVLAAPQMAVTAVGDALQVSFDRLPLTAIVMVTVWQKGGDLKPTVYRMPAEQTVLSVAALQEGEVYCVRAHTIIEPQLHSSSTDTQCVSITGPDAAWRKPTAVAVTVILTAGLLFAVFWSVLHCHPQSCQQYFHKEPLPLSLQTDWDIHIPLSPKETEHCEQIHVVPSV